MNAPPLAPAHTAASPRLPRFEAAARDVGLWTSPHLERFLGGPLSIARPCAPRPDAIAVGWGRKPSGLRARRRARRTGQACWLLEDGFLRSCGPGGPGEPPLSLVADDTGIYYDAAQPSRLEILIATLALDHDLREQAQKAIGLIRHHRLSKYNHAPAVRLPDTDRPRVLVIDQTAGDLSVRHGGADAATFARMLAVAVEENPEAEIWVKTHPDVVRGRRRGYLDALGPHRPGHVRVLAEDACPLSLLEQVDRVYAVTSQMGFEALMLGKPVACFGLPWYAGWGLTDDRHPAMAVLRIRRRMPRDLETLFAAAYLRYARYVDPVSGKPCSIFDAIEWLARNKAANDAVRGDVCCVGMSPWKRSAVRPFFPGPSTRLRFAPSVRALRDVPPGSAVVAWGVKEDAALRGLAAKRRLSVWRMEDGFLRSVGLGSDLFRPVSLVLDRAAIHYDPASASDLERLLASQQAGAEELARAARFRQAYVSLRMSKYNLRHAPLSVDSGGRRVLLVPGQVEDDASVVRGSPAVRDNLALLRAVRAANPDAFILYKPHPDVVAGNRPGALDAAGLADQCVADANIIDCILAADEVHVMTSLAGFEALLHGRPVHCYGCPFYAGWGLTVDHVLLPRRQRRISLDELVLAAMLKYPLYVLPGVRGLVSAEDVLRHLAAQAARAGDPAHERSMSAWVGRRLRKAGAIARLLREALAHGLAAAGGAGTGPNRPRG